MSKWLGVALVAVVVGCDSGDEAAGDAWQRVHEGLPGALLSVWGTSATDVWTVGADARDGAGPQVLHFDGEAWTRVDTGLTQGDLWWVFGFADGPIYMGGDGGVIVRRDGDTFTVMDTPSTGTIYGIWGSSPDDLWAVGGESDASGGFAWRLVGDAWVPEASLPADVATDAALWKAFGTATDDVWLVGSNGVSLHWDGASLSAGDTGVGSSLFTVYAKDGLYTAVGGLATGIIVEGDGTTWRNVTPDPPPMGLAGVSLGDGGLGIAVGMSGSVYVRDDGGWAPEDPGLLVRENLHGAWVDDDGGLWAVGGQTLTPPLTDGVMIHRGTAVPEGVP